MHQPFTEDIEAMHADMAERARELAELWQLGAETAVIEQGVRRFREIAQLYFDREMACVAGNSLGAAKQRRAYETMIAKVNAVLADFADGEAVEWFEMFTAIKDLLAGHSIEAGTADFPLPVPKADDAKDALVVWTRDLEVGIDWQDRHHRGLVGLLNQIGRLPAHYDRADADALLERFRRAAWHHFHEEEARLSAGAEASQHIAAHRHLLAELDRVIFDVRAGRAELRVVARHMLRRWLVDHILSLDRRDFYAISRYSDTD